MAQGTGINYNPITGEQQEYTYYYQPQQAPDPMAEQQKLIDQAYRDLPLQQAEEAAKAAMVYQGQRGYMRDLANGLSAPEALSKWAPLMFARTPGQGASMVRANPLPKPNYQFVPGAGGAPNRFEAPGERPVFVPNQGMTPAQQIAAAQREKEFEYRKQQDAEKAKQPKRKYLDPSEQSLMNADAINLRALEKQISQIVPQKPGVFSKGNLEQIQAMKDEANALRQRIQSYGKEDGKTETPTAPIPSAPSITEAIKRFTFDPKTRKLIAK